MSNNKQMRNQVIVPISLHTCPTIDHNVHYKIKNSMDNKALLGIFVWNQRAHQIPNPVWMYKHGIRCFVEFEQYKYVYM